MKDFLTKPVDFPMWFVLLFLVLTVVDIVLSF